MLACWAQDELTYLGEGLLGNAPTLIEGSPMFTKGAIQRALVLADEIADTPSGLAEINVSTVHGRPMPILLEAYL